MGEQLSTRALIFGGHGIIGRLFTSNPWVIAVTTSCIALLFLHLPAWLLGLDRVLDDHNRDVGFFVKYNWSLVYPLLAPILICLSIIAFRTMRDSVYELIDKRRIPVIVNEKKEPADDYPLFLSKELARGAGWIEVIAGVSAFAITAVDTKDLWPGFINGGKFPDSRVPEWDTAFRIPGAHLYGHVSANCMFDIVAYTFQTGLIFLGLVFVIKYWMFLRAMVQIIDRDRPPYEFKPWVCDLYRRLGLKPLGWVFNLFLTVIVLFQLYGFYHRIELIDAARNVPANTYVKTVWNAVRSHKEDEGQLAQLWALAKLPTQDYAWSNLANPSSWLPLLLSILPILVVLVLPLGRLFFYLRREIQSLMDEANISLANARNDQDREIADDMEKRWKCLSETTIWPNGSVVGSIFVVLMFALVIGTIAPPVLLWGIATGIILKLIWSVLGKPS